MFDRCRTHFSSDELRNVTEEGLWNIASHFGTRGSRLMISSDLEAAIHASGEFNGLHF